MTLQPLEFDITTNAGDSLPNIASRVLGDPSRFREIADLNGLGEEILGSLPSSLPIRIPSLDSLTRATPIFNQIADTVNGATTFTAEARGLLSQAQGYLSSAGSLIPEGYTQVAQEALAEVNGAIGEVESIIGNVQNGAASALRQYDGRVRLIDWLLV